MCALLPHCLPAAVHWMQEAIDSGGAVFVHCHSGKSRSGAVVAGFLMQRGEGMPFEVALEFVRKRRVVVPNAGFRAHLRAYQAALTGDAAPLPSAEAAEVEARDFADRKLQVLATYEGVFEWGHYDAYRAAFTGALLRGETDFAKVDAAFMAAHT